MMLPIARERGHRHGKRHKHDGRSEPGMGLHDVLRPRQHVRPADVISREHVSSDYQRRSNGPATLTYASLAGFPEWAVEAGLLDPPPLASVVDGHRIRADGASRIADLVGVGPGAPQRV